ncbi:lipopolysaccharide biosynthesis protein [Anaeromyxobacter paludicola]|uniref:Polysaccharide biosynthesis protein n=1 Tax=Anaeromyxobacter paludicola TaxID=2918171 RepID=A0ABN6N5P7_9BACT|nr:lipopolysaccharide biosynthesis protein [Anaeromyxobacter paludicola]BDG08517.1 hypothetical protein AMPC_16300 [Anaeromyxobacter paludicola]
MATLDPAQLAPAPSPAVDDAPPARQSLRANFSWTLAGHAVNAGSQWVTLVAIAKLAAAEAVGRYALGTAIAAPLFLFAGLNLNAAQVTDTGRRFGFPDYLRVRATGMLVALAAAVAIVLASSYDRQTRLVVLAVSLAKLVEGLSDIHYGCWQQHERMRPMAASLMLRGVLGLSAVSAVLWAGAGVLAAILGLCLAWLLVLLLHDFPVTRALLPRRARPASGADRGARWRVAGRIALTSLPLGLVMMLVSLRTNAPRYFIEHHGGAAELGVFAALSSLVAAANLVVAALGQSATPRLARHHFEGDGAAFRRLLAFLLGVAVALGGAGIGAAALLGRPALRLLFGPVYAARADLLVWLMGAGLVAYVASFLGCALTAIRRFNVQLPLFASTAGSCAVTSAWLVPRYGLTGAVGAWGLALLLEVILSAWVLWSAVRRRAPAPLAAG